MLQPTCVVTQTDIPYGKLINTVSIKFPSDNLNRNLIVPSLDSCLSSSSIVLKTRFFSNNSKQLSFKFFICENCFTRLRYNQSQICSARYLLSPCATIHSSNCSNVKLYIDFFIS